MWASTTAGQYTSTFTIFPRAGKTVSAVGHISRFHLHEDDNLGWVKLWLTKYCTGDGDFVNCAVFESEEPPTYINRIDNIQSIDFQLDIRDDDDYVYGYCPITVYYHN